MIICLREKKREKKKKRRCKKNVSLKMSNFKLNANINQM